ncbi:hypothetical protein AbraIFM66951_006993 [Aspergillus brasiliensis]|uniref:Uncharacterized protein n=1 Tax=Aspergillus brasiliensis TaxID=319629 RepID=A0A9W5YSB9_9EURO|nr:hypothetical protein AbraCBS73388_008085 [Aspergillus brasiliensis]GKZ44709.1 hypothetical protein AbraIFM66951_006993 [Aspergillus brasiliensis]
MHRKVSAIPEGQLQSFKWDLKTCLSDELVLLINKILETQVNITTISLLTDNDCVASSPRRPSCILNLAQLSKLQSLSWRGLKDHTDFESVKRFIAAHGAQLKTLHLDLIGWDSARLTWTEGHQKISSTDTWLPHNFFAQYVLGLQHSGVPCTLLPALQHLFLSQVAFTSMEVELVGALNIGRLQALQLVNCPGTFHFLRQIVRSGVPLRLKLLELTFNPEKLNQITDESQDNIAETVEALLKAFSSLTDLYLMLPTNAWDTLCKSAMHHKSLKRLITHWLVSTDWGSYSEGELFGPPERPCTISYYPGLEFLGVSTCIEDFDYKVPPTRYPLSHFQYLPLISYSHIDLKCRQKLT